ncbi:glycosyltransferase family 2 protein [Vibrio breoganii]|uniref:Glycosyltransferase family 2 protein n=1 Tax=Vibrio breoganii TaxID=553239 RepID=A0ABX1UEU0_9VIBR|nr:glycosyltransferase family 2 protein [Vibrio breoganii]NMO75058.1 glycosyltransferase [Vibrio breoganii]NMR71617.1 glycosyltransferase family 2 protein [Vibrio breoganii]OED99206.1 family 2 glycosyl transferase [Vibrio breoganii ZF-29]OEF81003.1 family 2 glycosyl transferase [Vibrio breoganii 1C10]PML87201.1 family 2 glycosyl transferase [Vibrio breoganii]
MKTSLIITTYNWKEALQAVLDSVNKQTKLPDEVIIADDGSRSDTAELISNYQESYSLSLVHSWQADEGFQLAKSRNKAIAKASGDYIVMIDGDIILHPRFIETHVNASKRGWFVQAGRAMLNEQQSKNVLDVKESPHFFTPNLKNRKNAICSNLLSNLFSYKRNNDKATRGCNMAFWRDDLIEVNGFNEDFIGWGREDSEFTIRMLNAGKNRLYLKFAGIGFHLYHKESPRELLAQNEHILNKTIEQRLVRCSNGLEKYLK